MPAVASDPRGRIVRLEAELEDLALAAERCRKTALLARAAAAAGSGALLLGLWKADGALLVAGITACLGGIVLSGSSRASRAQLLTRATELDAERDGLIDEAVGNGVDPG